MPKVSIIIPAFNAEKTIAYTINSVLAQTYSEFEVIVINDGSTDRTLEELIYLESQDSRIKLLNQKNMGVSAARNKGIKYSTGKYLMFLDADDFLDKMAIESLVSCIEKEKVDCVSTNYKIISKKTKYIDVIEYSEKLSFKEMKDKLYPVLLCDNSLVDTYHKGLWTKLYRSKIIKDNQINFCTDLQIYEDTLFVMEYLTNCHSIINLADIYFYNYVNNNSSVTNNYVSNCWLTLKLSAERAKKLGTNIKNIDKQYSNLLSRNAITSIINATKSMDIKKIPQRFKEIKYILSDKDLNHELSKIRLKDLSFARKTIILLIKYNMTYMLFALSYIYNVARG